MQHHIYRTPMHCPADTRRQSSSQQGRVFHGGICVHHQINIATTGTVVQARTEQPHTRIRWRVLLRDSQMHPWRAEVMHVDFQRVSKDRKIHMKVPLHFANQEVAPGVKTGGGIVSHVLTELDITCLPDHLPEYITVDLSELQLGQTIHLSDIKYPEGVESIALSHGDDQALVTIQVPRGEKEAAKAADAAPVAAAAAPAKT